MITPYVIHALLTLTDRTTADPLIQVLPLPRQTLLNQLLLLPTVRTKIFDECLRLLGRTLPHLSDLFLEVHSTIFHFFSKETLLHIVPHQQPFDLFLIELTPPHQGFPVEGACLCDFERVVRVGLLVEMASTT